MWGFKFGIDPLLGFVPILGDLIPAILSGYLIWIGVRANLPTKKIFYMVINVVLDYLIGFIPLLGDIFDFAFKASDRNLKILESHIKLVKEIV